MTVPLHKFQGCFLCKRTKFVNFACKHGQPLSSPGAGQQCVLFLTIRRLLCIREKVVLKADSCDKYLNIL